jgi:hypothetical protein
MGIEFFHADGRRRGIALRKLMVAYCYAAHEPNEPPVNVEIPQE